MKWKFSSKKEGSGSSRREILQNYEQKYLEKFDKVKSEIQKVQKKQKELEVKELKDRIARRLKLEKEAGKEYKKLISKKLRPKSKIESEIEQKTESVKEKNDVKEAKAEILAGAKSTIQKRVSNVFKGFRESESKPTTVAEDTRNFVRKRRTQRIETVEEVDVKKDDEDESVNKQIKKEEEKERIKAEKFLREAEEREKAEAKEKAESEKMLKEDLKKKKDDEDEKNERMLKEAEDNEKEEKKSKSEIKKMMEEEKEEYIKKMTKKGATLPRGYVQKTVSGGPHAEEEKPKKKRSKPKKEKVQTEKEIESKIAKLEKKLEKGEKVSSDFVKTTLETAVSEGWTKTKTVEELRKSKEKITIKKAKELVKEAFDKRPKKK